LEILLLEQGNYEEKTTTHVLIAVFLKRHQLRTEIIIKCAAVGYAHGGLT